MFEEVWIFADWKPLGKKERETILKLNVSDVVFGVFGFNGKQHISSKSLINDIKWLQDNNIHSHIMIWMHKTKKFISDINIKLSKLMKILNSVECNIKSILFDCEKNWHNSNINSDVGTKLVLDKIISNKHINNVCNDIKFGITGLASLHSSLIPLLKICNYCIPQAYAVWFPRDKHWSHSYTTEPEYIIKHSIESWKKYNENIIPGLACFYEKRPNRTINTEDLYEYNTKFVHLVSINYVKYYNINRCAYYSLKHVIGNSEDNKVRLNVISKLLSKQYDSKRLNALVQYLLKYILHYNLGLSGKNKDGVDGIWGFRSQSALNKFRTKHNIQKYGKCDIDDVLDISRIYLLSDL